MRILITCPFLDLPAELLVSGGVANYARVVRANLSDEFDAEFFEIGRRRDGQHPALNGLYALLDSVRLLKTLAGARFDVVHLNPSLDARALLRDGWLHWLCKMRGVPTIVFFRGWHPGTEAALDRSRLYRTLFRTAFGGASLILVLARAFEHKLGLWGVPAGDIRVETTLVEPPTCLGAEIRPRSSRVSLLFLGRFEPGKGALGALEVFEALADRHPELEIHFAGEGSLGPELRRRADAWEATRNAGGDGRRTHLHGYLEGARKFELLESCDIFVMPTDHEGFPNAIVEAMVCGEAIVTRSVGGIPDLLRHGEHGFLASSGRTDEIAELVETLIRDAELCDAIRRNNRAYALETFSAERVVRRLESRYRAVAHGDVRWRPH